MIYLLDTGICIYIKRDRPSLVREIFASMKIGDVGMSVISFEELTFGAYNSRDSEGAIVTLGRMTRLIPVLARPKDTADHYGVQRALLTRRGTPIGSNELWIAAHAIASDLTLVTNKEREFRRVDGLRVENWAAA